MKLKYLNNGELTVRSEVKLSKLFDNAFKKNEWKLLDSCEGLIMPNGDHFAILSILECKNCYCVVDNSEEHLIKQGDNKYKLTDDGLEEALSYDFFPDKKSAREKFTFYLNQQKADMLVQEPDWVNMTIYELEEWMDIHPYSRFCQGINTVINTRLDCYLNNGAIYEQDDNIYRDDIAIAITQAVMKEAVEVKKIKGDIAYVENAYIGFAVDNKHYKAQLGEKLDFSNESGEHVLSTIDCVKFCNHPEGSNINPPVEKVFEQASVALKSENKLEENIAVAADVSEEVAEENAEETLELDKITKELENIPLEKHLYYNIWWSQGSDTKTIYGECFTLNKAGLVERQNIHYGDTSESLAEQEIKKYASSTGLYAYKLSEDEYLQVQDILYKQEKVLREKNVKKNTRVQYIKYRKWTQPTSMRNCKKLK